MDEQQCPLLEFDYSQGLSYINNQEHDLRLLLNDDIQDGFIQVDNFDICDYLPEINFESNQSKPANNYSFEIVYVNFPTVFFKKQVRWNNRSMQRIENGNISFLLDFKRVEAFIPSIPIVSVKVRRTILEQSREFLISCNYDAVQSSKLFVQLDLDSVYEDADGYKVYELEKSLHSDLKKFHLIIEVRFANNYIVTKNTHSFTLTGRKRKQNDEKRERLSFYKKASLSEKTMSSETLHDASPSSISSLFSKFQGNEKVIECSKLVAKHIETESLQANQLRLGNAINTSNGDIAYHWPLENPNEHFEEGEVVGFIADAKGKYVLTKLTLQNCKEALLKGVISRSYYLEARVPKDGRRSETICLMGIVPIQVKGSVCINDALYASPNHPGFAVSGYHLTEKEIRGASLIGYAFASQKVDNKFAEGMVQAGVSVLETVSQWLHDARLHKLEEAVEEKLEAVKYVNKRSKKYNIICFITCITLAILTGIYLYQNFVPGSSFRYFLCRRGRLSGSAFFRFTSARDTSLHPLVRGIEFEFSTLMKKTAHTGYKRLNMTGVRYYLNVDRCAYKKSNSESINDILLRNTAYGPDLFAVDKECFHSFYYDDLDDDWRRYNSVSWEKKQNIICQPGNILKNISLSVTLPKT